MLDVPNALHDRYYLGDHNGNLLSNVDRYNVKDNFANYNFDWDLNDEHHSYNHAINDANEVRHNVGNNISNDNGYNDGHDLSYHQHHCNNDGGLCARHVSASRWKLHNLPCWHF